VAGPAYWFATSPASTNSPDPIVPPTPTANKSTKVKCRSSVVDAVECTDPPPGSLPIDDAEDAWRAWRVRCSRGPSAISNAAAALLELRADGSEEDRSSSASASYVECRRGWLLMAVALVVVVVVVVEPDSGEVRRLTPPVDDDDDDDELMVGTADESLVYLMEGAPAPKADCLLWGATPIRQTIAACLLYVPANASPVQSSRVESSPGACRVG
jgi:hypothetical protein